jgi:anti-sigma regulatory factor (Ser/Thr protein kinase)
VGAARRFVRDVLMSRRVQDQVVDTVELLTSELVTNALIHARSAPELCVCLGDRVVRVEVCDADRSPAFRRTTDTESASGRGIAIVEELATQWGVEQVSDNGKLVWFEVAR